ncbi:uncharacterized protein LOC143236518 [Tachypleus tridentatus]|uniref:uncharacterized protein LOC143236518 n=1 Tax=Tachypleus tridentatus TaxID=6853 RepID=UPI003FD38BBA
MALLVWKLVGVLFGFLDHSSAFPMPCSFNPLCTCDTRQQETSCVSVPFLNFPKIPFKEVYQLTFARTGLPVLYNESLDGTAVSSLRLMYNNLVTLPLHVFRGSEHLMTSLDLSHNQINEFPVKALRKLSYLQWLNLNSNKLEDLSRGSFEKLWSRLTLSSILLGSNHISFIEDSLFRGLRNVTSLDLTNNHISKLEGQPFPESLTTLSLSDNLLDWIPPDALSNLRYLKMLNLGGNLFPSLPSNWKLSTRHLDELDFSHNVLTQLESDILNGSFSVHKLSLSYNYLRILSVKAFRGLHLQKLSLANNRLSSIPIGAFEGLEATLTALDLSFNIMKSFPKAVKELEHLQQLLMRGNQLSYLEKYDLYACRKSLEVLDLSRNLLKVFQKKLCLFNVDTTILFPLRNSLKAVELGSLFESHDGSHEMIVKYLNEVEWFQMDHNKIFKLSSTFLLNLTSMVHCDLEGNNVVFIPQNLFRKEVHTTLTNIILSHNEVRTIEPKTFSELPRLRNVVLLGNRLEILRHTSFTSCPMLNAIVLSHNRLRNSLHRLFLSFNKLTVIPPTVFTEATNLQVLQLDHNSIKSVSSTDFQGKPPIQILSLRYNNISTISPEAFTSLEEIRIVDLSYNRIATLPESAFVGTKLERINLSHNIIVRPLLKFFFLTLTLANNLLRNISALAFRHLQQLRHLDLSHNLIEEVPSHLWAHVVNLHTLDISHNPIEILGTVSFSGLKRLVELDMRGLALKYLDSRTLQELRFLRTFKTSTYANVRSFQLHDVLHKSVSLRRVVVEVEEPTLSHQLQWTFGAKLRDLTITGRNLQNVLPDAFLGLHHSHKLILRITGTNITRLPSQLLRYLSDIRYLTLDLRNNCLQKMERSVLQPAEDETGEPDGTKHITGGVLLENNPWVCDCDLTWLSRWLRRWMRETLRIQMFHFDAALYVYNLARRSTCVIHGLNTEIPIIDLKPADINCLANDRNSATVMEEHFQDTFVIYGLTFMYWCFNIYHDLASNVK